MTAKTILILKSLTDEQQAAFIEGWENAGGFMGDLETPNPWCCPWDWTDEIEVEVEGETLEEMGADWWRQNKAEIEALIAEEKADAE